MQNSGFVDFEGFAKPALDKNTSRWGFRAHFHLLSALVPADGIKQMAVHRWQHQQHCLQRFWGGST